MRLTREQINNFKNSIKAIDADAKIYLFGSRTSDDKKGGDIDLAIFSKKMGRMQKAIVKNNFFKNFGEQKIDLVIFTNDDDPFWQVIKDESILLAS